MFDSFDLMVFNMCKRVFYMLPGDSILGYPVGQMVSLIILTFGIGEAALYFMPNAMIKKNKEEKK